MAFKSLNKDELKGVAEFFVVDVEAANPEKGPNKGEYLAALAQDEVTWEQYNDVYLVAKQSGQDKSAEVRRQEAEAEAEAEKVKNAEQKAETDDVEAREVAEEAEEDEPKVAEDEILVKYERKNPTWQAAGYTFTKAHPFASVPVSVAEFLISKQKGFRLALPSEVTDYYS